MGNADGQMIEKPVFFSDAMGSYGTTANKVIAYGDWSKYALVRNQNISVLRNPYLYGASGQTAFHFTARWGGAVILAEAFQYATTA
jgi:HK97 family phage major capsid protein